MAYNKQIWATGNVITAEKLNHIEDGIENNTGTLIIHQSLVNGTESTYQLDKTWNELKTAFLAGKTIILADEDSSNENYIQITRIFCYGDSYNVDYVDTYNDDQNYTGFSTLDPDGYPSITYSD